VDFEDFALIKLFLSCGGPMASSDGLWWPSVVMGGGGESVRIFRHE